ncbi:MAG: hypothetical protein KDK62_02830 [Chlamydiia bacterium]|nr:hypothetical protein [Chlamydiia bacterium]
MNRNTAFYTKLFLNRFTPDETNLLLDFFPEGKEAIEGITNEQNDPSLAFQSPEEILLNIHYSWLAQKLSKNPKEMAKLYLAAFPKTLKEKIQGLLNAPLELPEISFLAKRYLQLEFLKQLLPEDFIPAHFTPKSDLKPLGALDKNKMVEVIDFLGLFDLTEEMKKIVDTKLLKKLNDTLSSKQKAFIKECMQKKDNIQAPPFPLYDWNGNKKELKKRIHKKGLIRLSKALSGEDPRFIWHVTRTLDTGRGKILNDMISEDPTPNITEAMKRKTLLLISYLQKD